VDGSTHVRHTLVKAKTLAYGVARKGTCGEKEVERMSPSTDQFQGSDNSPDRGGTVQWHAIDANEAVRLQQTESSGLSDTEAASRQQRYGPNTIATARQDGPLRLLLRQLASPLLFVLLGSGAVALLLGKVTDGVVVLGVVVVNALIGFVQEYRAHRAITALSQFVPEKATVCRSGRLGQRAAVDVVPGDVVVLQSGDRVPADLRLMHVKSLQIDESALTGEAVPSGKQTATVAVDSPLGDRVCMAFGGTMVTFGTGTGVVVATGSATELGRISALLRQTQSLMTPLTRSMERVSLWLTVVILGVTAVLFAVGLGRGYPFADATVAAISLAVAAIPEGLPAIITIALAVGVRRMAKRRVMIRSLPAVETLGSTTVICSDKTGTLTRNEMTVQAVWTPKGSYRLKGIGYEPEGDLLRDGVRIEEPPVEVVDAARAGALCNDSALRQSPEGRWGAEGDPTEVALIVAARKLGLDVEGLGRQWRRVDSVPFESERQIMGTLHEGPDGRQVIFLKGAPEVVFARCGCQMTVDARTRLELDDAVDGMAEEGLRVLAMAARTPEAPLDRLDETDLAAGFRLLGLQGMSDPPRQEAVDAVAQCGRAGIQVKMITGDHASTARAIGRQLGLGRLDAVVTGSELGRMSEDQLESSAASTSIFARVSPEDKLRLVSALQRRNEVVAMTGDGVNDAPALKRADIGVAMGITGTAVSRQAADMVLADDNFASIVAAVQEGRRVFDNLVKSLVFVLPTNIGEALVILVAVLLLPMLDGQPTMPILPVQILWVNLVATVALALPLAFEAMEPDVMNRAPRAPKAPLLDAFVITRTLYVAALLAVAAIGLYYLELHFGLSSGRETATATREAQTAAVTGIVAFQIFYLFMCRSLQSSLIAVGLFTNPLVFLGVGAILLLQVGFVYVPFMHDLFGSAPLALESWLRAFLVGAIVVPVVSMEKHLRKAAHRRHHRQTAHPSAPV
jgi:magnesium-transporting ATPase (P-type)